jgi:nucleotide-binding universal stress UspA family protein
MSAYPTKILVASDGSEESKLAVGQAAELAEKTGSELHLVHVGMLSHWVHPDTLSPQQYKRLKDEAQKRLDDQVKDAEAAGAKVTAAHLRMGRVDAEIIKLSEELDAGLIIVGNRGMGAIRRILLGSDAESIVRYAHCPVMVVRSD